MHGEAPSKLSCFYWCGYSVLDDFILADSLSTSLGTGLSITLKTGELINDAQVAVGGVAEWSEHLQHLKQEAMGSIPCFYPVHMCKG